MPPAPACAGGIRAGADALIKLLKNYCRNKDIKTSIHVGVIGYPNVGKSSLINSLKRSKVCGVGATPGFTKTAQLVQLDKNIKLLDCPGIVFATGASEIDVLLRNCIKVENIEDPANAVAHLIQRVGTREMMRLYAVAEFSTPIEFLATLAQQRGKLKKVRWRARKAVALRERRCTNQRAWRFGGGCPRLRGRVWRREACRTWTSPRGRCCRTGTAAKSRTLPSRRRKRGC